MADIVVRAFDGIAARKLAGLLVVVFQRLGEARSDVFQRDAAFRALFSGSPVKRIGRNRFLRNVLIAAGNSGDPSLVPSCLCLLDDSSPLVRGAAVWALSRLMPPDAFMALANSRREDDPSVSEELHWAVERVSKEPAEAA